MYGDSYRIGNTISTNTSCFREFNESILKNNDKNKQHSIIIEYDKYKQYSEEDLNLFLESVKELKVIDFEKEYIGKDVYLHLNYNNEPRSYLQYTGMIIRTIHDDKWDNYFGVIGKHFINLCKFFKEIDKGLLFTLACNIYIFEFYKLFPKSYGFNYNHSLMDYNGCKILTIKEITELLDKNNGINYNFSKSIIKENFNTYDNSKESYLKLIKQNGIK